MEKTKVGRTILAAPPLDRREVGPNVLKRKKAEVQTRLENQMSRLQKKNRASASRATSDSTTGGGSRQVPLPPPPGFDLKVVRPPPDQINSEAQQPRQASQQNQISPPQQQSILLRQPAGYPSGAAGTTGAISSLHPDQMGANYGSPNPNGPMDPNNANINYSVPPGQGSTSDSQFRQVTALPTSSQQQHQQGGITTTGQPQQPTIVHVVHRVFVPVPVHPETGEQLSHGASSNFYNHPVSGSSGDHHDGANVNNIHGTNMPQMMTPASASHHMSPYAGLQQHHQAMPMAQHHQSLPGGNPASIAHMGPPAFLPSQSDGQTTSTHHMAGARNVNQMGFNTSSPETQNQMATLGSQPAQPHSSMATVDISRHNNYFMHGTNINPTGQNLINQPPRSPSDIDNVGYTSHSAPVGASSHSLTPSNNMMSPPPSPGHVMPLTLPPSAIASSEISQPMSQPEGYVSIRGGTVLQHWTCCT